MNGKDFEPIIEAFNSNNRKAKSNVEKTGCYYYKMIVNDKSV